MPSRRQWTPARSTWETRLVYLIQDRGIEGVSNLTNRSPRTIRSWLRDGRTPSVAIRRSLARQGREVTGPAQQSRPGQPARIVPPRVQQLDVALRQRAARRLERRREQATTPAQREMIDAISVEEQVDDNLLDSLSNQMDDMYRREAEGERYYEGSELFDDWESWRDEVDREYGRVG